MNVSLSNAVIEYQNTGKNFQNVFNRIAAEVYFFPRLKCGFDDDAASEFFLYFYPKIEKLIERFRDYGKPFEAYLHSCIRWQIKSFVVLKRREERKQQILLREEFWNPSDYPPWNDDEMNGIELSITDLPAEIRKQRTKSLIKRIVLLAMKGVMDLNDAHFIHISTITGLDFNWLLACSVVLKERMNRRIKRLNLLKERRNKAYIHIQILEEELSRAVGDEEKNKIACRLKIERKRFNDSLEEISKMPMGPTHKDIADVISMPKGSVDSGIYYIKNIMPALHESD